MPNTARGGFRIKNNDENMPMSQRGKRGFLGQSLNLSNQMNLDLPSYSQAINNTSNMTGLRSNKLMQSQDTGIINLKMINNA